MTGLAKAPVLHSLTTEWMCVCVYVDVLGMVCVLWGKGCGVDMIIDVLLSVYVHVYIFVQSALS